MLFYRLIHLLQDRVDSAFAALTKSQNQNDSDFTSANSSTSTDENSSTMNLNQAKKEQKPMNKYDQIVQHASLELHQRSAVENPSVASEQDGNCTIM